MKMLAIIALATWRCVLHGGASYMKALATWRHLLHGGACYMEALAMYFTVI